MKQIKNLFKMFPFVLLFTGVTIGHAKAQSIEASDSLTLVAFFNATNGPGWVNNTNWLTAPLNTWFGVTADSGEVTRIALEYNNLSGSVPIEIGNLSHLQELYLYGNQLYGNIPSEMGNLSNLHTLYLNENLLSGSIPAEIGNLSSLQYLYLNDNQLSGNIPSEIGNLVNLYDLSLYNNGLSGEIPVEVGNLLHLRYLSLFCNQLGGNLPHEIGNLLQLQGLFLFNNQFTGDIPAEIGNLINLTKLYINHNLFTGGIPETFNNLHNLVELQINNCLLEDLPNLTSMVSLDYLHAESNRFTFEDIEPNIGVAEFFYYAPQENIGNIQELFVNEGESVTLIITDSAEHNTFEWFKDGNPIPDALNDTMTIANISATDVGIYEYRIYNSIATELIIYSQPIILNIKGLPVIAADSLALVALYNSTNGSGWRDNTNWLTGPVNTWNGITISHGRVTGINLYANNLIGTLPPEIGNLLDVKTINLGNNRIGGSLPSEICSLLNLQELLLSFNQFTGTIPEGIFDMSNLLSLGLTNNQLTGNISSNINHLAKLTRLELTGNQFTGTFPSTIWGMRTLQYLQIGSNELTGSISPEIENLSNLQYLNITGNGLTGTIPKEIGNLPNLQHLQLNALGQITGNIPPEIGNLSNLQYFWIMGMNQISGNIPHEVGNLSNLLSLVIAYTPLTGDIPIEIGNLSKLTTLDLFNNKFTGNIFPAVERITGIHRINIANNKFSGIIPAELGNLNQMWYLELSNNQFYGSIPTEITNLTNLVTFNIQNNMFDALPDLSQLSSVYSLKIESNRFTFEDIESNVGVARFVFTYSPQDSVGEARNVALLEGEDNKISISVGGANNQYQWFKNGVEIIGAVNDTLVLADTKPDDVGVYTCQITNTLAGALTLYSRPVRVTKVLAQITQQIPLKKGWNLVSFYVTPENINLMEIVRPLINEGSLVMVKDETGKTVEFIRKKGWLNKIGTWKNSEGYAILVNKNTNLLVTGLPIRESVKIDLNSGWNLISYPSQIPQNALDLLDGLIDSRNLVKVQDETGASVEWINKLHKWVNEIGNFKPGEGYKVLMSAADTLEINQSSQGIINNFKSASGLSTPQFYENNWKDNGMDQMNIFLFMDVTKKSGFNYGDEVGVFDRMNCVGSIVINELSEEYLPIVVSADDPMTDEIDGFVRGDSISFKTWKKVKGNSNVLPVDFLEGSNGLFEPNGTALVVLKTKDNESPVSEVRKINAYPNPFKYKLFLELEGNANTDVIIQIRNAAGEVVYKQNITLQDAEKFQWQWDGCSSSGDEAIPGLYLVHVQSTDRMIDEVIKVVKR